MENFGTLKTAHVLTIYLLTLFPLSFSTPVRVSGLYSQQLPLPLLYDTFIPVVYEFILPHWNKTDITLNNWYNCLTETAPYKYSCPVVFHMNKAVLNLHVDFGGLQPVVDRESHKEYYSTQNSHMNFCNLIQKHFSSIYIQKDELFNYYQSLERCRLGTDGISILETGIQDFNFTIRHPFNKMEANFYNNFYKVINSYPNSTLTGQDLIASATLSNSRATVQSTLLTAYYAEKYRWNHAVQDCGSRLIPQSIILSQKFSDTLDTISKEEKFKDLDFTIPLDLISKYYSLPIADCTYTNDSFVVRLQIPVTYKKKSPDSANSSPYSSLQLFSLTPAPFYVQNHVCTMPHFHPFYDTFLYNSLTKESYWVPQDICKSNELCYAASVLSEGTYSGCIGAVLSQNWGQMEKECHLGCRNGTEREAEIGFITQVTSDQFILTGSPGNVSADVKCYSQTSQKDQEPEVTKVTVSEEGAVEISLSCSCYIEFNGQKFYPGTKCRSTFIHTPILPHLSLDRFGLTDNFENIKITSVTPGCGPPSTLALWIVFGIISLILLLLQSYIIYELRFRMSLTGGGAGFLFSKRNDDIQQVGLIDQ